VQRAIQVGSFVQRIGSLTLVTVSRDVLDGLPQCSSVLYRFEHWFFTFPLHVCDYARLLRHRFKAAPPRNSDAIIALAG
jgi:hypothetical protein